MSENIYPKYGYSVKNSPYIVTVPPKNNKHYSLIAAITENKLLGYMVFEGSVKTQDYGGFILKLIETN